MFCPQCGISPSDTVNFCNSCGANLQAVRQAMVSGSSGDEFTWSKTWVATMFLSGPERKLRAEELERRRGITPEVKRAREMKAGVMTACAGISGSIVLYVLMQGIIAGSAISTGAAAILSRVWILGLIPLMIGIGLILFGLGARRWLPGSARGDRRPELSPPDAGMRPALPAPATGVVSGPPEFSVTEGTTRHLEGSPVKR